MRGAISTNTHFANLHLLRTATPFSRILATQHRVQRRERGASVLTTANMFSKIKSLLNDTVSDHQLAVIWFICLLLINNTHSWTNQVAPSFCTSHAAILSCLPLFWKSWKRNHHRRHFGFVKLSWISHQPTLDYSQMFCMHRGVPLHHHPLLLPAALPSSLLTMLPAGKSSKPWWNSNKKNLDACLKTWKLVLLILQRCVAHSGSLVSLEWSCIEIMLRGVRTAIRWYCSSRRSVFHTLLRKLTCGCVS